MQPYKVAAKGTNDMVLYHYNYRHDLGLAKEFYTETVNTPALTSWPLGVTAFKLFP